MSTYNNVIYGGLQLEVNSISPSRTQKTIKSVVGKTIIEVPIIGMGVQQWNLEINGVITTDLSSTRGSLEALDDAATHAYVDGIHDGNYLIKTGSLSFEDIGNDAGMIYRYSMSLIQK